MTLLDELRILAPMILAFASQYAYGTLFSRRAGFATRCLIGTCAAALVVGILANVAANLISAFVKVAVTSGLLVSVILIARKARRRRVSRSNASALVAPLLLGCAIFVLNNPASHILFVDAETSELFLRFNPHYSYFSSLSSEMAAADYVGRLRIQNQWPIEWSAYHFFASGVTAVIQTFGENDLVGYFYAQLVILIALVLSFRELFVGATGGFRRNVVFVLWVITGLSFFEGALRWLLYSNSAISLWATVGFLVFLFDTRRREAFFLLVILGLSSTRLVPVAAAVMLITIVADHPGRRLYKRLSVNPRAVALYTLGIVYLGLTFFSAPVPSWAGFFNKGALDETWHHLLMLYRATGFALSELAAKPLPIYSHGGDYLDFFATAKTVLPSGILWGATILLTATLTYAIATREIYRRRSELLGAKPWHPILLIVVSLISVSFLAKLHGASLFPFLFIFGWYIACVAILAHRLGSQRFLFIVVGSMAASLIYLLTGSNAVKGPVSYSMFEVPLWTLLGLLMMRRELLPFIYVLILASWIAFPPHIRAVGVMDSSLVVSLPKEGPLDKKAVDAAFEQAIEEQRCSPELDVYAAILGRRVKEGDATECFITRDFVVKR